MAISIRKYVDIVSGVGGGAAVRLRDLITRIFTMNPLVPTGSFIEFESADDVGTYFGFTSEEYKRALFYFGWISPNITRARKISFASYTPSATAPRIFGADAVTDLGDWQAVSNGAFVLSIGGDTVDISPLDFTAVVDMAGVASVVQTAIQAETGTMFTSATVTFSGVTQAFNFVGGDEGEAAISLAAPSGGTDIRALLGWTVGAILSDGAAAMTASETLSESANGSNNFGSFLFMPGLDLDGTIEAAQWNATQNVLFQYLARVTRADASAWYDALKGYAGTAITLESPAGAVDQYPEMVPGIMLAATDYTRRNGVMNYMFKQFALSPSVTETPESNELDLLRVNYYGRTQTAGQFLDFYQRGTLMGGVTAPVDMNVYGNEQWLKDAAAARLLSLLLSLARVSANTTGRNQVRTSLQAVIDQALFNGTVSVGKPLDVTQQLYITEQTGDELAWLQVQNIGYWLDVVIQSYVTGDGRTEWKATYLLIYSKDDAIRKVEGTHTLI